MLYLNIIEIVHLPASEIQGTRAPGKHYLRVGRPEIVTASDLRSQLVTISVSLEFLQFTSEVRTFSSYGKTETKSDETNKWVTNQTSFFYSNNTQQATTSADKTLV
jgi:hypothetical protein